MKFSPQNRRQIKLWSSKKVHTFSLSWTLTKDPFQNLGIQKEQPNCEQTGTNGKDFNELHSMQCIVFSFWQRDNISFKFIEKFDSKFKQNSSILFKHAVLAL